MVRKKVNFEVTDKILEDVKILAGRGMSNELLAQYYGMCGVTWFKYCNKHPELRVAFQQGQAKTIAFVAGKLVELAASGNISAIIFYLKTRAGWSEVNPALQPAEKVADAVITASDPIEAAKMYQKIMQAQTVVKH